MSQAKSRCSVDWVLTAGPVRRLRTCASGVQILSLPLTSHETVARFLTWPQCFCLCSGDSSGSAVVPVTPRVLSKR